MMPAPLGPPSSLFISGVLTLGNLLEPGLSMWCLPMVPTFFALDHSRQQAIPLCLVHPPRGLSPGPARPWLLPTVTQLAFSLWRALLLISAFHNHIHSSRPRSKDTPCGSSPSHPSGDGLSSSECSRHFERVFPWQFGKMRLCT